MRTLVVGYGSIGKRHARLLQPLVSKLAIVTKQTISDHTSYTTLDSAVSKFDPQYVVICSATDLHGAQLHELKRLNFGGTVLVEKPIAAHVTELDASYPFTALVGYNLRFHPVITALRAQLGNGEVLIAHAYVGQHLAQWRPDRAPRDSYSAHKIQGGGVLRDLSHELDLLQYLFGTLTLKSAEVARLGDVTVDSEDSATLLLSAPRCSMLTAHMNYLDHTPRRFLHVITKECSIMANLITGEITVDVTIQPIKFEADDSYRAMHENILAGKCDQVCSLQQGRQILELIEKVSP